MKRKKESDGPSRPLSAYNFFFKEQRLKIIEEINSELDRDKVGSCFPRADVAQPVSFKEMAKLVSERWQNVSGEDLTRYKELAQKDLERYRREVANYSKNIDTSVGKVTAKKAKRDKTQKSAKQLMPADGDDKVPHEDTHESAEARLLLSKGSTLEQASILPFFPQSSINLGAMSSSTDPWPGNTKNLLQWYLAQGKSDSSQMSNNGGQETPGEESGQKAQRSQKMTQTGLPPLSRDAQLDHATLLRSSGVDTAAWSHHKVVQLSISSPPSTIDGAFGRTIVAHENNAFDVSDQITRHLPSPAQAQDDGPPTRSPLPPGQMPVRVGSQQASSSGQISLLDADYAVPRDDARPPNSPMISKPELHQLVAALQHREAAEMSLLNSLHPRMLLTASLPCISAPLSRTLPLTPSLLAASRLSLLQRSLSIESNLLKKALMASASSRAMGEERMAPTLFRTLPPLPTGTVSVETTALGSSSTLPASPHRPTLTELLRNRLATSVRSQDPGGLRPW